MDYIPDVVEKYAASIFRMCGRGLDRVVAGSRHLRNVRNSNAQNKINIMVSRQIT
jgi:hypothetical protein